MGGLIARASLSEPGHILTKTYLGEAQITDKFTTTERGKINNYFNFKPLTQPSKVIFLATPHRGSKIATGLIGWAATKLITIPSFIIQQTADTLTLGLIPFIDLDIPDHTKRLLSKGESSIDQLKPNNPSIIALNKMPLRRNLDVYSIIGDKGQPYLNLNTDGVVSYQSSHLPNAKEEIIIPSNHDICSRKKAIDAVIRILQN